MEVKFLRGRPDPAKAKAKAAALMAPFIEEYEHNYQSDAKHIMESARDSRFRYTELERSILQTAGKDVPMRVREAITSGQLAGSIGLVTVQNIFEDYEAWPAIFRDLAEIESSNSTDEVYPEEWADDMPVPVAETEPAPESRASGGMIRIRNYEYARTLVISKRLYDRDKTNHTRRLAANFGRKYPQAMDKAFVNGVFRTGQLSNLTTSGGTIPKTNLAGQSGIAGFNATGAGPITPQRLEDGLTAPAFFVDPFGLEIVVDFDTVFVDSFDRFKARRFLTAGPNPVIAPATDATGQLAGQFTPNVLAGEVAVAYSPYVKKSRNPLAGVGNGFPWALMEAKTGAVMQIVHELLVEQETPQAGKSFEERSYRWQGTLEFGTGVRNARLIYFGN